MERIFEPIKEAIYEAGLQQAQMVESVLQQLVAAGRNLDDMCFESYPDEGREVLRCADRRVLLIKRSHVGLDITIRYYFYPDGRPDGWPRLEL